MARERILVVDDEAGVRRAIERTLGRAHDVTAVASAEDALSELTRTSYDIVIADVRMPGMDGIELLGRVKASSTADVIIMTGTLGEGDERLLHAIEGGAYFFLTKPFERTVLEALVDRCLATRRLQLANQRHVEAMERSLEQARRFQESLFPRRVPTLHGARLAAHWRTCERLGGDLYDFVRHPDGSLDLFIADVSGHGASAAMFTGIVKVAFRRLLWESDPKERAADLCADLRAAAALMGPASFLTAIHATYDPVARTLSYWNAGHPPLVALAADGAARFGDSTIPVISPALPAPELKSASLALAPGERLLLYSDGLVEARNPAGEVLGLDAVLAALRALPEGAPAEALYRLEELADAFRAGRPVEDDITAILLAVEPEETREKEWAMPPGAP